jgi:isopenicillin N synthase-like dioxygenase
MTIVPELSLTAYTDGGPAERRQFSERFMAGLQRYGFIVLKDHGVDVALLRRAYALTQSVFALPDATKRQYAAGMRGYTPFGTEHAKDTPIADLKEFWQIGHEPAADSSDPQPFPPNVWPAEVADFEATIRALFDRLNETGMVLLESLEPRLGLPHGWFAPHVRKGTSILRILHYPPVPGDTEPGAARSAAHEDINFITIMVAAEGAGLELLDRDGRWLPVQTEPTNLIVDSGDMLQRLTNGVVPATTHRVVNPAGPNVSRYSMPFFMHPTLDTSLKPLDACIGEGAKFGDVTAGEYLHERLRAIGMAK